MVRDSQSRETSRTLFGLLQFQNQAGGLSKQLLCSNSLSVLLLPWGGVSVSTSKLFVTYFLFASSFSNVFFAFLQQYQRVLLGYNMHHRGEIRLMG